MLPASSRTSAENPPKTTETPRSGSHTIWWLSRAVGPLGSWDHDEPFQAQVSMYEADPCQPPYSTSRPFPDSYVTPDHARTGGEVPAEREGGFHHAVGVAPTGR